MKMDGQDESQNVAGDVPLFGQSPKDWNAHTAFDGLAALGGWIHALSFDGIQAGFVQPLEAGALLEEG
jgi:hypothetical protein